MNPSLTSETPAERHEPHWVSRAAFPLISAALFATQFALGLAVHHQLYWLAIPLVIVASHFMHGQLIGFHEASHGLLRKSRRLNEFDGVLIGIFSFMSFTLYRAAHQTHHMHLATERDEELWPFVHPRVQRWKRILAAILELTAGLLFTPSLFLRTFLRSGSPIRSRKVRRRIWFEFALMGAVWTGALLAISQWGLWNYFLWLYLAPAVLAANLQSWRKYVEHVGLTGRTPIGSTRSIISSGWPGRLVALTLLHEPFHGVHHRRSGLRHAELPGFASELEPEFPDEHPPYPSYRHALVDVLHSLADPRVGAQWLEHRRLGGKEVAETA